jgi:hypothetical protein
MTMVDAIHITNLSIVDGIKQGVSDHPQGQANLKA